MSLITEILTILETKYPDSTRILSSRFKANIESFFQPSSNFPLIIVDNEITKDNENKINNNVQKNTKIIISFLSLDSVDNSDLQSETLRANMETLADETQASIYLITAVRPIGRQKYKTIPLFHVYNSNLTGVALEMNVNYNEIVKFERII